MNIKSQVSKHEDGIIKLIESGQFPLLELFGYKKRKETKKKIKKEREINEYLNTYPIVEEKDIDQYKNKLIENINMVKRLLSKEIPGVTYNSNELHSSFRNLNDEYKCQTYLIKLFDMTDSNFDKYKKKSKNENLKNTENSYDYVEELVQDNEKRIIEPIKQKGFILQDDGSFTLKINGKSCIFIGISDEAAFSLSVGMILIVKRGEKK